jgi:hypothetical protein
MNDVHCQDNEDHPIHSDFWRTHPQLRRRGYDGYYAKALDYAHARVRNHYRALILETLERYDIDGLELDFMREPYLFSRGEEEMGCSILTEWLGDIRESVAAAASGRRHPIQLGIRVPSRPEVARRFGLDPVAWAQAGLIDVLVPTPRWASLEFDLPMRAWRELLGDAPTTLLGGLEVLYRPFRGAAQHGVSPSQAGGAAAHVLAEGADGVYLFNYFPSGQASGGKWWSKETYVQVISSMRSLDTLCRVPRTHALTGHDVNAPDGSESVDDALPAQGTTVHAELPTGPRPAPSGTVRLALDVGVSAEGGTKAPGVRVNGGPELRATSTEVVAAGDNSAYSVPKGHLRCHYRVQAEALEDCRPNQIDVLAAEGSSVLLLALSVEIRPAGGMAAAQTGEQE